MQYKIRFSEDRFGEGYDFKAGQTYELPHASCHRWVKRGVAEYVGPKPPEGDPASTRQPTPEGPKARVIFLEDRAGDDYEFKKGREYTLPVTSCRRWVRRQVAQFVGAPPIEPVPKEPYRLAPKEPAETPTTSKKTEKRTGK